MIFSTPSMNRPQTGGQHTKSKFSEGFLILSDNSFELIFTVWQIRRAVPVTRPCSTLRPGTLTPCQAAEASWPIALALMQATTPGA